MIGTDRVNQWLKMVGNFGVIAGFVLVAFQLSLNTEAIRLQSAMAMNREASAAEIAYMGETTHVALANAIFRPETMTDEQVGQVWAYMTVALNSALNTWIAYAAGFATEEDWDGATRIAINYLSFEVGQLYWKNVKNEYYPAEFVAGIDARMADFDKDMLTQQWKNIMRDVRELNPDTSE